MTDSRTSPPSGPLRTLAEAAEVLALSPEPSFGEVSFAGAAVDSREVRPGQLFAAIVGDKSDGHDYLQAAADAGAVAALVSRAVPEVALPQLLVEDVVGALGQLAKVHLERLRPALTVIGVTGSVGKTTTKDLLQAVLEPLGPVVSPQRSFNNEIGVPLTILAADARTRSLVLEMGADGPGNLAYLTSLAPLDIAVVLAVSPAHLAGLGSIEAVAAEKATLLNGLVPGGTAVLNADDPWVGAMKPPIMAPPAAVIRFGVDPGAHVNASNLELDRSARASFRVRVGLTDHAAVEQPTWQGDVDLALVGAHQVTNALAAISVAAVLGLSSGEILPALAQAPLRSPHRMALTQTSTGITFIDDSYNANPTSMRAALQALAEIGRGRRTVAVLGEMAELGPAAGVEHDLIGRLAVRLNISQLVVVGAGAYLLHLGAQAEGSWGEESVAVADLDQAAQFLAQTLQPGDVVLFKASNSAGLSQLAQSLIGAPQSSGAANGSAP